MDSMIDLWKEHRNRLRNYIAGRIHDTSATDDILQEVYLKAHTSLHTVKSRGSISAWLFRIAKNAIVDYYRSGRHTTELPEDLASPEEAPAIAELVACLHPLIAELPAKYRSALVLSEVDGLTQKEVAKRLGISLSGAKSRVQRGREKLRHRLMDLCDIEIGEAGGCEPRSPRPCQCG